MPVPESRTVRPLVAQEWEYLFKKDDYIIKKTASFIVLINFCLFAIKTIIDCMTTKQERCIMPMPPKRPSLPDLCESELKTALYKTREYAKGILLQEIEQLYKITSPKQATKPAPSKPEPLSRLIGRHCLRKLTLISKVAKPRLNQTPSK